MALEDLKNLILKYANPKSVSDMKITINDKHRERLILPRHFVLYFDEFNRTYYGEILLDSKHRGWIIIPEEQEMYILRRINRIYPFIFNYEGI